MADEICPNCKIGRIEREEVDIGVGVMSGPARCLDCGWSEQLTEYDFLDCDDNLLEQMDELRAQLDQIEHTKRLADSTIRLGRMYRYRNSYSCPQSEDDYWWTYRKVLSVDDDGYCRCLEFHIDRDGKASIHMETAFRF